MIKRTKMKEKSYSEGGILASVIILLVLGILYYDDIKPFREVKCGISINGIGTSFADCWTAENICHLYEDKCEWVDHDYGSCVNRIRDIFSGNTINTCDNIVSKQCVCDSSREVVKKDDSKGRYLLVYPTWGNFSELNYYKYG